MNKKHWVVALAAVSMMALAACAPKNEGESTPQTQEPSVEAPADTQPSGEATYVFMAADQRFTMEIPERFTLKATEVLELQKDGLEGHIYQFESETETFEISDIAFPGVAVNAELIEEEIEHGAGLEITRLDEVKIPNVGTFYGALIHDESLGRYNFYHRIQNGDYIFSVLQSRKVPYSTLEEATYKAMLGTLRFTEESSAA